MTQPSSRFERAVALGRRSQQVLVLSVVTGALTGAAVALFDWVVSGVLFDWVLRQPGWLKAVAPLLGLVLAGAALRWLARSATPATSDEYIRNFHDRHRRLDERPVLGRIAASVATLGFGGALGYEGPSIYIGAAIGSMIQRRASRFFSRDDAKLLVVAGAAAGVAAIFKAPATGAVFALEVPFQDDVARRMLLPALTAAAVSYITFVSFNGTTPLLPVRGAPPFDLRDLGGAAVLGLMCGVGARAFAVALRVAKEVAARANPLVRIAVAGGVLAGLYAASTALSGEGLTLGPGYRTVNWALDPKHGLALIVGMFFLRALATTATVAGGGAGGLFIPLVIQGVLVGRAVGGLFGATDSSLFPVIGIAAFLGAGYRVPLAAVMFVAETTGRPGFVVPGLIAAAVAQLAMGRSSVSPYQVAARAGHLERRFSLPISAALQADVMTVPPDTTVREFFALHLIGNRQKSVPVVDESHRYLGMARMDELDRVEEDEWETTAVSEIARDDLPTGRPDWTLREAVGAMQTADIDRLPVVDSSGRFIGVVSTTEILKLDEILGEADSRGG
ncbi:MAG: chloride channel protein [Acidimicrobiia bacterium]|nr:chloride channel protein [Acidimicrobiia bacterium]